MPPAIARFRERHPGVELTLTPVEPEDGMDLLRSGDLDIALDIRTSFGAKPDDGIDRVPLLADPMYVALPRDHPMAAKRTLKLEDLSGESWILGSTGSCPDASIFLRSCQAAGFDPTIVFNSDDYPSIQGFIAAGMGVSFIPDLALMSVRDDIVVRSLGARAPLRHIAAATLKGSYKSPAKQAMIDVLVEIGREFSRGRAELSLAS